MSSSFANSLDQFGGESLAATLTHSFDDCYLAPHSFPNFDSTFADSRGEFISDPSYFSTETNDNRSILPPPLEMEHEESDALREWRRKNAIRLEEKETREKQLLSQIIVEADEFKVEFQRKRLVTSETNRVTNREKEQVFVANLEKFHREADKDYWKSIAELIHKEVPTVEKRKGKKEQEKKGSVAVIQGPKPGKPTDLSRMRQLLFKLKQNTPPHLKQSPIAADDSPNEPSVAVSVEPVAVA